MNKVQSHSKTDITLVQKQDINILIDQECI